MKRWSVAVVLFVGACGGDDVPTGGDTSSTGGSSSSTATSSSSDDVTSSSSGSSSSASSSSSSSSTSSLDTDAPTTTTGILDVFVDCNQCSTFAQDCPVGQRCVPWSCDGSPGWNGTRCSPIADEPAAIGEPCTMQESPWSGLDDCERAAMCWEVDEGSLQGTCIGLCSGTPKDPLCADDCAECLISGESVLALCIASCDPTVQDCDAGDGCYLVDQAYVCAPTAAPDAVPGDSCDTVSDCAPGDACVNGDFVPGCVAGEGCCTPFCTVGEAGGCDEVPASVCTAVFPPGQGPACVADSTGICVEP